MILRMICILSNEVKWIQSYITWWRKSHVQPCVERPLQKFQFYYSHTNNRDVWLKKTKCLASNVVSALWPEFCVTKLVIFKYHIIINLFRVDWLSVMFFQSILTVSHKCTGKKCYDSKVLLLVSKYLLHICLAQRHFTHKKLQFLKPNYV